MTRKCGNTEDPTISNCGEEALVPFYGTLYITCQLIIKGMITAGEAWKVARLLAWQQMGTYIFLANTFEMALWVAV